MNNNNNIFRNIFNCDPQINSSAHARVNLIGEHTDYTGGYVLPCLLSYKTSILISENNNNIFEAYSAYFNEKVEFIGLFIRGSYLCLDSPVGTVGMVFNTRVRPYSCTPY